MGWNPEKWDRFTYPHLNAPKPGDVAKKYADGVKEEAEGFEDDIDLDALGIQRVKEFLAAVAAVTPGSEGPTGPSGTPTTNAITQVAKTKTNLSGGAGQIVLSHTFSAGELSGAKDLIKVEFCTYNLNDVQIEWVVGINVYLIYTYGPAGASPTGHHTIWIAQATNPFDVGSLRALSISIGMDTYSYENTAMANDWMSDGGLIRATFQPNDPSQPWGGFISFSKFIFPQVTIE